jgi:O-antigen/teichoic acid export membrane protein
MRFPMKNLNVIFYFGANLAPRLATFVLLLVLTRLLSMDDYGMFALVVVTGEILDMATGGWVRLFVLSSESNERVPSAGRVGRTLVLTALSCVLSLLGALLLSAVQPSLSGWFTVAVCVYVLAFAVLRLGLTLVQTQQRHALYAGIEIARGVLSLACGVGAVTLVEPTFFAASLGISLVTLVGSLACLTAFRVLPWPYIPRRGYRGALLFGVPIVSVTILAQTVGWLDRFILNHALGPASVVCMPRPMHWRGSPWNCSVAHSIRICSRCSSAAIRPKGAKRPAAFKAGIS